MQQTFFLLFITYMFFSCRSTSKERTPNQPYGNNPSAGNYYEIRGFKMYCETYGDGEPLLLIHGNGGSIKDFVNQIPYFSKKYKVIAADSRNQGKSQDTGDSLSYEMMADDFAALLRAMDIDSAFVIGWSDGGINGLLLAARQPGIVKKLASTGANLWPDSTAIHHEIIEMTQPAYTVLHEKVNRNDSEKTKWKLVRLLLDEPHISLSELNRITCPTLVIGGDHDVIKEEHTMLIYKNLPKAYLWILPNSGHKTLFTYKDEFNKTVDQFFSNPYKKIVGTERFK